MRSIVAKLGEEITSKTNKATKKFKYVEAYSFRLTVSK